MEVKKIIKENWKKKYLFKVFIMAKHPLEPKTPFFSNLVGPRKNLVQASEDLRQVKLDKETLGLEFPTSQWYNFGFHKNLSKSITVNKAPIILS